MEWKPMTTEHDRALLFQEVQQFRQRWLWALLLGINGVVIAVTLYRVFGSNPDPSPVWVLLLVVGVACLNTVLFAVMKLNTEVSEAGILIHYFPLKRRSITRDRIRSCEALTYRPIRDYGGWGIRRGWSSMAYTVQGDRGVWVELTSGRPVLIGSQRAEALAEAIASLLPPS
ncbi:hypothetical protein PN441_12255 [Spirulina major CS-329]|uniref:hypothetical protein n=2 Tax=Spirulinaceae TaxID=1890448 RepID=UPI0023309CC8|nr:hypothetical protein [Spirulina major]MDB9503845.1 hypothetical protein [Spirulina major CS-329]